jgi:magnesium chelatase family protein
VRGVPQAIRALELAAAGAHNLLFEGGPGAGKTMLARRLPGILPPLTRPEAIEVTRIHSVAGLHYGGGLIGARPFRAPHHTISASGLVGGGSVPMPGEASLAHNGVLFLDELSEFSRSGLEALRQPLEDGRVAIVRGQRTSVYPTRFMLVAATNPCPCGYAGDERRCACGPADIARHRRRLSGPLLDRLDLLVSVERPAADALTGPGPTTSAHVRDRVLAARERQARRFAGDGILTNGQMDARAVRSLRMTADARDMLDEAYERTGLSARARHRVLRVACTAADLEGSDRIGSGHLATALTFRQHQTTDRLAA